MSPLHVLWRLSGLVNSRNCYVLIISLLFSISRVGGFVFTYSSSSFKHIGTINHNSTEPRCTTESCAMNHKHLFTCRVLDGSSWLTKEDLFFSLLVEHNQRRTSFQSNWMPKYCTLFIFSLNVMGIIIFISYIWTSKWKQLDIAYC